MSCDRTAQVHLYHDDELLDPAGRAAVEAHVRTCGECAAVLGELRRLSRAVDEAPLREPAADVLARLRRANPVAARQAMLRTTRWMTAAAAVVMVAATVAGPVLRSVNRTAVVTVSEAPAGGDWELATLMVRPEPVRGEPGLEFVQAAQWMADGLGPDTSDQ